MEREKTQQQTNSVRHTCDYMNASTASEATLTIANADFTSACALRNVYMAVPR